MRTKNFFKSLAVAAVALVGVFATSCSEEELKVNTTPVEIPDLPDGFAQAVLTVVDLGDLGVAPKVLGNQTISLTVGVNEIPCPSFDGSEEYVIPEAQKITIEKLEKGTSLTYSLTFYVIKKESAFSNVNWDEIDEGENPDYTAPGTDYWGENWNQYFTESTEISGLDVNELKNESDYETTVWYNYVAKGGATALEEVATARLAPTADEEIIREYVKNASEWQSSLEEYPAQSEVPIPAWSYANIIKVDFYTKPVYEFSYGEASLKYTCINYHATGVAIKGYEAIPGHDHGHDHGHGHGGSSNAGGGSAE